MISVSGSIKNVLGVNIDDIQVWVRSQKTRPSQDGLIVNYPKEIEVRDNSTVSFDIEPGLSIMLLVHEDKPTQKVPLLIPEGVSSYSLAQAVEDGKLVDEADKTTLEKMASEVTKHVESIKASAEKAEAEANKAEANANKAKQSETKVKQSETKASQYKDLAEQAKQGAETAKAGAETAKDTATAKATEAEASATKAKQSETKAKASETKAKQAEQGAETAKQGAETAKAGAETAKDTATAKATEAGANATKAKQSETKAKQSETKASQYKTSAEQAKQGAETAKAGAEQAKQGAESAKDTATAKATEAEASATKAKQAETKATQAKNSAEQSATQASGYKDQSKTYRDEAEQFKNSAQSIAGGEVPYDRLSADLKQRLETLKTDISKKALIEHTHAIGDVEGLQSALDSKANSSHTHTIRNVSGLQSALDNKANSSHTHSLSDINGAPSAFSNTPTSNNGVQWNSRKELKGETLSNSDDKTLTNKQYVDGKVSDLEAKDRQIEGRLNSFTVGDISGLQSKLNEKANTSHTHTLSQITDMPEIVSDNISTTYPNTIAKRDSLGILRAESAPLSAMTFDALINKSYADGRYAEKGNGQLFIGHKTIVDRNYRNKTWRNINDITIDVNTNYQEFRTGSSSAPDTLDIHGNGFYLIQVTAITNSNDLDMVITLDGGGGNTSRLYGSYPSTNQDNKKQIEFVSFTRLENRKSLTVHYKPLDEMNSTIYLDYCIRVEKISGL